MGLTIIETIVATCRRRYNCRFLHCDRCAISGRNDSRSWFGWLDRNDFANLDNGVSCVVLALVGDEVGGCGGQGGIEVEHGFEVEMADGVIVRWGAGWEGADAAIDFDPDESAGSEKTARDGEVLAEVVFPVKGGARCGWVEDAEADHGVGIQGGCGRCQWK